MTRTRHTQSSVAGRAGALATALCLAAFSLSAQNAGTPERTDYSAFRAIAERNIFNANRSGRPSVRTAPEAARAPRVDAFALVGTMSYRKGPFAFFSGTSPDYRTILQPGGTIAGHTLVEIASGQVQLTSGTNLCALRVGMQLRRENNGPWQLREHISDSPSPGEQRSSDFRGSDDRRSDSRGSDGRSDWRRGDSRENDSRRGDPRDWRRNDERENDRRRAEERENDRQREERENELRRVEMRPPEIPPGTPPPSAAAPEPGAAPGTDPAPAPSLDEIEILRRLMQQREQELR